MHTIVIENKVPQDLIKPGEQLSAIREKKGYTLEYIANKLHLRVRLLELLESDAYEKMPQPVFIRGYIRAYAKLLSITADPIIDAFNHFCVEERKIERALWQTKRETNINERALRWGTGCIMLVIVAALVLWWQKNTDSSPISLSTHINKQHKSQNITELKATSTMQSLFKTEQ